MPSTKRNIAVFGNAGIATYGAGLLQCVLVDVCVCEGGGCTRVRARACARVRASVSYHRDGVDKTIMPFNQLRVSRVVCHGVSFTASRTYPCKEGELSMN